MISMMALRSKQEVVRQRADWTVSNPPGPELTRVQP